MSRISPADAAKRIKKALRKLGFTGLVRRGRGTAYDWIEISGKPFGTYFTDVDRALLTRVFGRAPGGNFEPISPDKQDRIVEKLEREAKGLDVVVPRSEFIDPDLVPAGELYAFAAQYGGKLLRREARHYVFRFPSDESARSFYWVAIHGTDVRNPFQRAISAATGVTSIRTDEVWVHDTFFPLPIKASTAQSAEPQSSELIWIEPAAPTESAEQRTEPHALPARVPVRSIRLYRAEGRRADESGEKTVPSFDAANFVLRDWAETAPKDGSYHKTDFMIVFADGEEYKGRLALVRKHATAGEVLAQHVRKHILFPLGLWKPLHMTEKQYRDYLAQMEIDTAAYERLVEKYDVPGLADAAVLARTRRVGKKR